MKKFFISTLFIFNLCFAFNFDILKEALEMSSFNKIGSDHLNRIWLSDTKAGKIKFLIKEDQREEINSIKGMDLILDIDLDWGEIFANFGGNQIYIFKEGIFIKNISSKDPIIGICWINNEEIAYASFGEDEKIKIVIYNVKTDIKEELPNPMVAGYKEDIPYIYLKYNYTKKYLYIFDFLKTKLIIFSMENKKPILQFGMEKELGANKYDLVIKKEAENSKGKISYKFLLPKRNFGQDKAGNFYIFENCSENKEVEIKKILLTKEMERRDFYPLKECPENLFYIDENFIFYTLKGSRVTYFDIVKDKI